MDAPSDPVARQLALTALTTEHFNLQSARGGTISEANGRSTLYLGTLSSAVIALAFAKEGSGLDDRFYLFGLVLLLPVFLLGVFTYLRLAQTLIEDLLYTIASLRIREFFVSLDPAVAPYFPPSDSRGVAKLERMGVLPTSRLQILLTAASMVACIDSIVGGVCAALSVSGFAGAPVPVAAVIGVVVALALAATFLLHEERRLLRTMAAVPDLFEWGDSGMPDWARAMSGHASSKDLAG
jgi:hypothetical protein